MYENAKCASLIQTGNIGSGEMITHRAILPISLKKPLRGAKLFQKLCYPS